MEMRQDIRYGPDAATSSADATTAARAAAGGPARSSARVGIVTINDDANFGNRLQNYALQQALASLGWHPETIRNDPPPMSRRLLVSRAWHALQADGAVALGRRNGRLVVDRLRRPAPSRGPAHAGRRRAAIARFAAARITFSSDEYAGADRASWSGRYSKVVVGSDQVWNHGFRNAQELDFLTFAAPEGRVAYAASFGVDEIPTFLRPRYRAWLNDIPHISVREYRGAEIIEDLLGRTVPVVVDPTLLLDRLHWRSFAQLPEQLADRRPYAVRFFLGQETTAQARMVEQIARERGVRLVDLGDLEREDFADLGPTGFVAALAQADFVATDSFHAGVFSLIHHTPVVVRARHRTDSRLRSLLDLHGIECRPTAVPGMSAALDPDWSRADSRLASERQASWAFLEDAVGRPERQER